LVSTTSCQGWGTVHWPIVSLDALRMIDASPPRVQVPPLGHEDQRKLHAEVNQIIHQRFLLTTTAITVFGAFSALMLPRVLSQESAIAIGAVLFVASSFLQAFFVLLFTWNRQLLNTQFILVTYLRARGASEWEEDVDLFHLEDARNRGYFSSLNFYGVIYFALGLLGTSWPFAVGFATGVSAAFFWIAVHISVSVAYFIVLIALGRDAKNKARIHASWLKVLQTRAIKAPSGAE
jgi:hypothetical protein